MVKIVCTWQLACLQMFPKFRKRNQVDPVWTETPGRSWRTCVERRGWGWGAGAEIITIPAAVICSVLSH